MPPQTEPLTEIDLLTMETVTEPGIAPPMPLLVSGLPVPEHRPDGTWVPYPRDRALGAWVQYCRQYPERIAQPLIDSERALAEYQCTGERDILLRQHEAELAKIERQSGRQWTWLETTLVVVGAFLSGAATGFLVGEFVL
jgi:hypothetical protein